MKRIIGVAVIAMLVMVSVGCNKRDEPFFEKPTPAISEITVTRATTKTPVADPTGEPIYTPTAIPAPTGEVLPTEAVTPMEEPVFNEEVMSTEEPVEVSTEEPIPTEEVVSTKEPTSAPILTATPAPTATTALTSTPAPTSTPELTVTPKPIITLEPTATPTPIAVKGISVGDTIVFGNYEQDNNLGNGKEPIEWYVLDIKDGNAFLLAKYVLDYQPFDSEFNARAYFDAFENNDYDYSVTWDKSTIRTWLNEIFLNVAFSEVAKEYILLSNVENLPNILRGTYSGEDTKDKVYLISESEAIKYFGEYYTIVVRENRDIRDGIVFPQQSTQLGEPTEYAKSLRYEMKMGVAGNAWSKSYCSWALRTAGGYKSNCAYIKASGFIVQDGGLADGYYGIRPCLWLDLVTAEVGKVEIY